MTENFSISRAMKPTSTLIVRARVSSMKLRLMCSSPLVSHSPMTVCPGLPDKIACIPAIKVTRNDKAAVPVATCAVCRSPLSPRFRFSMKPTAIQAAASNGNSGTSQV
ncbi:MAG TPA: hypothetical protein DDW55_14550 [Gammaproteobacteria bacterium]|nr:hypothetical protein [Gammaproteobacteria bacterium]